MFLRSDSPLFEQARVIALARADREHFDQVTHLGSREFKIRGGRILFQIAHVIAETRGPCCPSGRYFMSVPPRPRQVAAGYPVQHGLEGHSHDHQGNDRDKGLVVLESPGIEQDVVAEARNRYEELGDHGADQGASRREPHARDRLRKC